MSKLRTKYESHEAKRALCAAYDLFLADERIIPVLPKLLGALQPFFPGASYINMLRDCQVHTRLWQALSCARMLHVRCRQGLFQKKEAANPG